jgi:hypothetical protein
LRVTSVPVDAATLHLLPKTGMCDAYRVIVDDPIIDAAAAASRIFARAPSWIETLMRLRNGFAKPLGLKADIRTHANRPRIGFFPVISEAPGRVVLGLDDKHLDFRISVDVAPVGNGQRQITATTLVRTHNLLGRAYLAAVLPFHRVIVPAMLAQAIGNGGH